MRVLVAPDSFGNTLTAVAAAAAIAEGWRRARPDDHLVCLPLSDGGPGFIDCLASGLNQTDETPKPGIELRTNTVTGPAGNHVRAHWLIVDDAQRVSAYIECAQACGLHLLTPTPESARDATSAGVGQLIAAAHGAGVQRIVLGLGGSATTDGGANVIAALAKTPSTFDVAAVRAAGEELADTEIVVATDVENPLVGDHGAAAVFGPQKGADAATVAYLDARLGEVHKVLSSATGKSVEHLPGAGAAGGIGAALLAIGGRRVSGADVIFDAVRFEEEVAAADVVVTGEGRLDEQTLRGKVVAAVAAQARVHDVPVLAMAGQVQLTAAQCDSAGIAETHAIADIAKSIEHAMSNAGPLLAAVAQQCARARRVEQGSAHPSPC